MTHVASPSTTHATVDKTLLRHARPGRRLQRIESIDRLRARRHVRESDIGQLSLKGIFSRPGVLVEDSPEVIALDEWLNEVQPNTVDLALLR